MAHLNGQPLNMRRVLADQSGRENGIDKVRRRDLILATPQRCTRHLSQAHNALVRVNLDEQERRHRMRALPTTNSALRMYRDLNGNRLDAGDFHILLLADYEGGQFGKGADVRRLETELNVISA